MRGPGSGEDGADSDRSDLELDTEPFDGVHEPLARQIDHHGAAEQKQDVNHRESLSR